MQNRSLETLPVCIVWQCFPHNNTVCIHMYDECKRSDDMIVCHKLWSILWSMVQVCSLIIEYQVSQYVSSIRISELFESILLTILPIIVESSCLPTHNIVPHISWHDLPYRRNTKKYTDFPSIVIFLLLLRKFWIQTWPCNCQHYPCLFHIVFEYTPCKNDLGKMLVLPNQLLYWVLSTSDQCFCFFRTNFYVIHIKRYE